MSSLSAEGAMSSQYIARHFDRRNMMRNVRIESISTITPEDLPTINEHWLRRAWLVQRYVRRKAEWCEESAVVGVSGLSTARARHEFLQRLDYLQTSIGHRGADHYADVSGCAGQFADGSVTRQCGMDAIAKITSPCCNVMHLYESNDPCWGYLPGKSKARRSCNKHAYLDTSCQSVLLVGGKKRHCDGTPVGKL